MPAPIEQMPTELMKGYIPVYSEVLADIQREILEQYDPGAYTQTCPG